MALSSGNTINQRIALTGGDEIKNTLKELGQEGEDAFNKIKEANQGANSGLGRLSDSISRIRSSFDAGRQSYGSIATRFHEMAEGANKFGESLVNLGERIIPHFQEVIGLGAAAGVAGFLALEASAARTVNQLSIASRELGVPIDRLQGLGAAARIAGTETEAFFQGLLKISQDINQIAQQRRNTLIDAAAGVAKGINLLGPTVLRGPSRNNASGRNNGPTETTEKGVSVLRGASSNATNAGYVTGQVEQGVTVLRGGGQSATQAMDGAQGPAVAFAKVADDIARQNAAIFASTAKMIAQSTGQTLESINKMVPALKAQQQSIQTTLATSEAAREEFRKAGFSVPFVTMEEALKHTKDAGDNLAHTLLLIGINVFDLNGKKKGLEEVLSDFNKWFETEPDRAKAAGVAKQLLGDNYANLLKLFAQGSENTKRIVDNFVKSNLGLKDWSIQQGQALNASIGNLEVYTKSASQIFALAFSPAIIPLIDGVTKAIDQNFDSIITYAQKLSTEAVPAINDFVAILTGTMGKDDMNTQFGVQMLDVLKTVKEVALGVGTVLTGLMVPINAIVNLINGIFGTNFNAGAVAAIAIIGQVTGVWYVLGAAVGAVDLIISTLITGPIASLIVALGPIGLLAAITLAIAYFIDWNKVIELAKGVWQGYLDILNGVITLLTGPLNSALSAISNLVKGNFAAAWDDVKAAVQGVYDVVIRLGEAIANAIGLKEKLASVPVGQVAPNQGGGPDPAGLFAGGGSIMGPGGVDNVPIWATAGEFMVKAAAVGKYGTGFLHAINSMALPRFAEGGIIGGMPLTLASDVVPSIAGIVGDPYNNRGSYFTLNIGGEAWHNLFAPEETAKSLVNFARKKGITSAGDKGDWYR